MTHESPDPAPTDEQLAIDEFVATSSANLMIQARAGCGKSHVLKRIANATDTAVLLVCFNKAVAEDAIAEVPSNTTVRTFNSIGHRVWSATCAHRVSLNKNKILDIYRSLADELERAESKELWAVYDAVISGVNLARALGYIPAQHSRAAKSLISRAELHHLLDETPDELTSGLIDKILLESIRQAYHGIIDFNDQVYMPALFGGTFPKFPLVLIDEYQDLSPVNHVIVSKLCRESRQIGVGDEAQAIYGFRGAHAGGMEQARKLFDMHSMPLTVSFRCPSAIVANVHWRVPEFRALREGGRVNHKSTGEILDNSAVICRNNAPLIRAALHCLAEGHSVSVAGTDIGQRLIKQLTKLGPETLSRQQAMTSLEHWLADRLERNSKSAKDMAECMKIFIKATPNLSSAIGRAKSVFAQTGTITMWTGHKSKGLEFDRVYHLDSDLVADRNKGQDGNVAYVIDTRPRESLTYITTEELDQ